MAKYVDIEKIMFELASVYDGIDPRFPRGRAIRQTIGLIKQEIQKLPAADVAEVKHGKWILEREPDGTPYCFHCSVCDDDFHHIGIMAATDYCPNCGARMDKEE